MIVGVFLSATSFLGVDISGNTRGLFLTLCLENTPGKFGGPYVMLRTEPRSATCKTNSLPALLSLQSQQTPFYDSFKISILETFKIGKCMSKINQL